MSINKINLYFDATASHPIPPDIWQTYCANLQKYYANPASVYESGIVAQKLITDSLRDIASTFNVAPGQLLITSGATESINTVFYNFAKRRRKQQDILLIAQGEHAATVAAAKRLADDLQLELIYVPLTSSYLLDTDCLENLLQQYGERILALSNVSLSNETGTINDLMLISRLLKKYAPKALWHVDNVQGWGKIAWDFVQTAVDYVSMGGHKIGAPKGCGLLYIKEPKYFKPFIVGGGQQNNMRSGTENPPLVRAMADAALKSGNISRLNAKREYIQKLRDLLLQNISTLSYSIQGAAALRQYPGIVAISFPNIRGEVLLHSLEREGISVSTASSCHNLAAGKVAAQKAACFTETVAQGHLRITINEEHQPDDILILAKAINKCVSFLAEINRK